MSDHNVVHVNNLDTEFDIGGTTPNKISVKLQTSITKDPTTGAIGVNLLALDIVSTDAGNILSTGTDGGAFFDQAAFRAVETLFNADAHPFMTVTAGGTNGHEPFFSFDWQNADFKEAVQDAVGEGIAEGLGLTYDDALNAIGSAFANMSFGDGLQKIGDIVSVLADPSSPMVVSVGPNGVSVAPAFSSDADNLATAGTDGKIHVPASAVKALNTVEVCDAFGTVLFHACP